MVRQMALDLISNSGVLPRQLGKHRGSLLKQIVRT